MVGQLVLLAFLLQLEQLLEVVDFILEFVDQGIILRTELLLLDFLQDEARPLRKLDRADGLLYAIVCWGDGGDEVSHAVAPDRVLQQASEL